MGTVSLRAQILSLSCFICSTTSCIERTMKDWRDMGPTGQYNPWFSGLSVPRRPASPLAIFRKSLGLVLCDPKAGLFAQELFEMPPIV
jgi:hypothetical protein